jgi:catechol 2,3-dioxygenase-like lactoylglutathione lyase family enzyme
MAQQLAQLALLVNDYDKAIEFYTKKLNFTVAEDTVLSETKRWVLLSPNGSDDCKLLLAKAANDEQKSRVGNQTGGRVFLFLYTDDFEKDYNSFKQNGVEFAREVVVEKWGKVAVFKDLYGNLWDLIEKNEIKN